MIRQLRGMDPITDRGYGRNVGGACAGLASGGTGAYAGLNVANHLSICTVA
ncbi:hypothetical protein J6TS7_32900 [Paenibacillus dendritiformis]|nr:hypothetical protein J6TS7_32900 [Paenibacillus dendritiformis]